MIDKIRHKELVVIFICAVVMRIILHISYTPWWVGDSGGYVSPAVNFFQGSDCGRTPLYPIFLGFISLVTQSHLMLGARIDPICANFVTMSQTILGLIAIFLIYKTMHMIEIPRRIAFLMTLLYAISVPVISFEMIILPESLSVFMVALSVYFFVKIFVKLKAGKSAYRVAFLAGFFGGLTALGRPNTLVMSVVFLACILFFLIVQLIFKRTTFFFTFAKSSCYCNLQRSASFTLLDVVCLWPHWGFYSHAHDQFDENLSCL